MLMLTKKPIIIAVLFVMAMTILTVNVNAASTPDLIVRTQETTAHSVTLEWSESNDLLFVSYVVQYRVGGTLDWTNVETISSKGTTNYRVTDLESLIAYDFRILDKDSLGTGESNIVTEMTLEAPTNEGMWIFEPSTFVLIALACFGGGLAVAWVFFPRKIVI